MSLIRRLGPGDAGAMRDHLLRLSADARRERFAGQVGDASIARYVDGTDWLNDALLGWIESGRLRAAVHLIATEAPAGRQAELAVTVEPAWQNRGIGTELCRRALLSARNRAVRKVCMICLQENRRMQTIVRKLEGSLLHLEGMAQGVLDLPHPNYLSFLQEALRDGGALVEALADQWQGAPRPTAPRTPRGLRARAGRSPAA